MNRCFEIIEKNKLVPCVSLPDAECAVPVAAALEKGGVHAVEIMMRTDAAIEGIEKISAAMPDYVCGAGTVLTPESADAAMKAGAGFIVSPGFDERLVDYCIEKGYPVIPGVATPGEIQKAYVRGLRVLKFFPSEALGGLDMLKQLSGPFPGVRYLCTGGINAGNIRKYIDSPLVFAAGGTFVTPKEAIIEGKYDEITALCRKLTGETK